VTRILHYGDSPTTADSITADVRRLLQARFGDAGHGFLLIANPWAWYGHNGVTLKASGWKIEPASQARAADGIHGLGGVSFRGEAGATSSVTLPDDQHTSAIVYYLKQPGGGTFEVLSGASVLAEINTAGETKEPAFEETAFPPGTQTIELRVTSGSVRLFGYRFDKDQPGVQYSSLGINGAQVQMILRAFENGQWAAALQHEAPDLVVLNYGTNESIYPAYIEKQYPDELRTVIRRIRAALPHTSILVMSPMDRGVMEAGEIVTPPVLETLIGVQERIAAETGCAFFNTYQAMGGAGTMGRWYHEQPRLVSADFMHPLPQGAAKVGKLFADALVKAYEGSRPVSRQ
jgi:lysophospholipase L1-like esterase